jgi:sigma-B regulation protein RsbQ
MENSMLIDQKAPNIILRNNVKVLGSHDKTILYAHGFGCHQGMWDAITPAFASSHKQVVFDYVGSGSSDLSAFDPQRYAELAGYAQDILEICDALELTRDVTFVGHSVSCSIGIMASILRPGLFGKLILVGPNPCFINHPPDYLGGFEKSDLEDLLDLMDQNYIGWANYLAPVVSAEQASHGTTLVLSDSFCSTDPIAMKVFAKTTFFADNRSDLPKVTVPCLILQHRTDSLAPVSTGEYLHTHIPNSQLKILEVQGHCAHMSAPDLVIDAIRQFID